MGEGLGALQAWFAAHCDGNWEQEYGVSIGTIEDPGWELRIDLVGTPLEGSAHDPERTARAPEDWCEARSDGYTFHAMGGPHNLGELLDAFASFAERHVTSARSS
jgi:hypothetical protein